MAETPTHVRLLARNNAWKRGAIPELAPSEGWVEFMQDTNPLMCELEDKRRRRLGGVTTCS